MQTRRRRRRRRRTMRNKAISSDASPQADNNGLFLATLANFSAACSAAARIGRAFNWRGADQCQCLRVSEARSVVGGGWRWLEPSGESSCLEQFLVCRVLSWFAIAASAGHGNGATEICAADKLSPPLASGPVRATRGANNGMKCMSLFLSLSLFAERIWRAHCNPRATPPSA